VSRSKHTDPRHIRATRRVRAPFESRSANDASLQGQHRRILKHAGLVAAPSKSSVRNSLSRPRIIERSARRGFYHPAGKRDIVRLLEAVGPVAVYGLRSIELTRAPVRRGVAWPIFGRYRVPGTIVIYEQPRPPWRLTGLLAHQDMLRFKRAGAVVVVQPEIGATVIDWPQDTLRWFILEDVVLHELGHHVLQHHKAKRRVRVARTKDHEAFAARFAARQRQVLHQFRDHNS
jgi:hypothetical protein